MIIVRIFATDLKSHFTMVDTALYDKFEEILQKNLISYCTAEGCIPGGLLQSVDIDDKWEIWIKEYFADAIKEYNAYPQVCFAWAGYVGLALAKMWDSDWTSYKDLPYSSLYGERGFDDLDDNVTTKILGLDLESYEAKDIARILRSCATEAISLIRHQGIEAQSVDAFYVIVRGVQVIFRIGETIGLHKLGYKLTAVDI